MPSTDLTTTSEFAATLRGNAARLLRHQAKFAEWLAKRPRRANVKAQLKKLNELAERDSRADAETADEPPIYDVQSLRGLKRRAGFKEYYEVMQGGGRQAALLVKRFNEPFMVGKNIKAVEMAHEAKDYAVMGRLTERWVEAVDPRKDHHGAAPVVTINLEVKQSDALLAAVADDAVEEVEYEVLDD